MPSMICLIPNSLDIHPPRTMLRHHHHTVARTCFKSIHPRITTHIQGPVDRPIILTATLSHMLKSLRVPAKKHYSYMLREASFKIAAIVIHPVGRLLLRRVRTPQSSSDKSGIHRQAITRGLLHQKTKIALSLNPPSETWNLILIRTQLIF